MFDFVMLTLKMVVCGLAALVAIALIEILVVAVVRAF